MRLNKDSHALELDAAIENFPLRKHNLIQAMLAVNDLFYLSQPSVESLFYEDVEAWLADNNIRFTPKIEFTGTTGYHHVFDFVIPGFKGTPERILRAINNPSRTTAESMIHAWSDTRGIRPPNSRAYALLNDLGQKVPTSVEAALKQYEIRPVEWSHRDEVVEELAA